MATVMRILSLVLKPEVTERGGGGVVVVRSTSYVLLLPALPSSCRPEDRNYPNWRHVLCTIEIVVEYMHLKKFKGSLSLQGIGVVRASLRRIIVFLLLDRSKNY